MAETLVFFERPKEPRDRIQLPPAESLQTLGSARGTSAGGQKHSQKRGRLTSTVPGSSEPAAGHNRSHRSGNRHGRTGDHHAGRSHLLLQQLAQQPLGRLLVASALDQTSSTIPVWSTARHNQCLTPAILSTTSSRCHLSPVRGSRRRIWLAKGWPNLRAHCRTVSWLTMMPRAANNSSTIRNPSGNGSTARRHG